MKILFLTLIILSACIVLEAYHKPEHHHDLGEEVVYRETRGVHGKNKDWECRYKKGPWSDCDSFNVQRKTLNLKRGDASCEPTKVITRKCKKACKYEKGEWSACDISTNTRVRADTLKPQSDTSCQPTRTISKKCKKVCKYNNQSSWSECDPTTGKKTKVLLLKSGNPQVCEPNKKISKSCQKSSGIGNRKSSQNK